MGTLYIVATPIGNLEDITIRAIRTLVSVPVIACEDTRRTGQLIKILEERYSQSLSLPPGTRRYISVRDWNEAGAIDQVGQALESGNVALVSDAGTPLISDPGFKVVRAMKAAGHEVVAVPGANAAIAAVSIAGLPTNKFTFWGFWQKKIELAPGTNVFYESPIRAKKTVEAIKTKHPAAEIRVACELTKIHEKVYTGEEFLLQGQTKGEVTILVYIN